MARAIWTGTIGFGLVSVPVRLYPATRRKDVRFREIDRLTGRRIHHQKVVEEIPSLTLPPREREIVQPTTASAAGTGGIRPRAGERAAGTDGRRAGRLERVRGAEGPVR